MYFDCEHCNLTNKDRLLGLDEQIQTATQADYHHNSVSDLIGCLDWFGGVWSSQNITHLPLFPLPFGYRQICLSDLWTVQSNSLWNVNIHA